MRRLESRWTATVLVAAVAVLGTLLAMKVLDEGAQSAEAQFAGEMKADYMIGLVGPLRDPYVPLFLVDTKGQKIMVYEYEMAQRKFGLRAARSFRYDRELDDQNFTQRDWRKTPTVAEVKKLVERQEKDKNKRRR